jgi:hypothetical protein
MKAFAALALAFYPCLGIAQENELEGIEVTAKKAPGSSELSQERALEGGAKDLGEAAEESPASRQSGAAGWGAMSSFGDTKGTTSTS